MPVIVSAVWALTLLAPVSSAGQDTPEEWLTLLERVVPEADRFTDRRGQPPVFEGLPDRPRLRTGDSGRLRLPHL